MPGGAGFELAPAFPIVVRGLKDMPQETAPFHQRALLDPGMDGMDELGAPKR